MRDGIYKRKDSPWLWASWTDESGKRYRRSTKTVSKREAQRLLARWRLEGPRRKPIGIDLQQAIAMYLDYCQRHKRPRTVERYIASAAAIYLIIPPDNAMPLTAADIRAYSHTRELQVSPWTLRAELTFLSAVHTHCARDLELDWRNPVAGRKPPSPAPRVRWLTEDEAARLIDGAVDWLRPVITLALHTGLRRAELMALTWADVDLGNARLTVASGKGGQAESVPLNATARRLLASLHDGNGGRVFPMATAKRLRWHFAKAAAAAGLVDVRIHDLRRTYGSWLLQRGVGIATVSKLLRHKNIGITARVYAHLGDVQLQDAVAVLDSAGDENILKKVHFFDKF